MASRAVKIDVGKLSAEVAKKANELIDIPFVPDLAEGQLFKSAIDAGVNAFVDVLVDGFGEFVSVESA